MAATADRVHLDRLESMGLPVRRGQRATAANPGHRDQRVRAALKENKGHKVRKGNEGQTE